MRRRITALLMACLLAVPATNLTVFGAETGDTHSSLASIEVESEAIGGVGGETVETETVLSEEASTTVTAQEESTEASTETVLETESEAATEENTESPETEAAETTETAKGGKPSKAAKSEEQPYDLTDANERYEDMTWDEENGDYIWIDEDGTVVRLDPEDPEFYDYVFGEKGKSIDEDESDGDESSVTNAYGFSGGRAITIPAQVAGQTSYHGIDVSKHQGNIVWSSAAADGVQFVIIRIGYTGTESGAKNQDENWISYVQGAYAAGIRNIGLYYYSQALNTAEAQAEAAYTASLLNASGLASYINMPIFMDYEYGETSNPRFSAATQSTDRNVNQAVVNAFCDTLYNSGYHNTGVYANSSMWNSRLNVSAKSAHEHVWVARWNTTVDYNGPLSCWQYSSSGVVNGISTRVDSNYWWGSMSGSTSASISISAASKSIAINESKSSSASTTLTAKVSPSGSTVTWSVSGDGASVTSTGGTTATFTATKAGTYTVKASAAGASTSVKITVTYALQESWFGTQADNEVPIYNGKAVTIKKYFPILDKAKTSAHSKDAVTYAVYYEKESVTTLTDVSSAGDGVYKVTIAGTGDYSGTLTRNFRIDPKRIDNGDVIIDFKGYETQDYVSTAADLMVNVIDTAITDSKGNRKVLAKQGDGGSRGDFVINTDLSDPVTVGGVVGVVIDGIYNYTGQISSGDAKTQIAQATLSSRMIAAIPDQYFTGEALTPELTITSTGRQLTLSTDGGLTGDYMVSYTNNTAIGTAGVTVYGCGGYSGEATTTFKIVAHPLSAGDIVIDEIETQSYTGSAITPAVNVWIAGDNGDSIYDLTVGTDYTVSYSSNKKIGTGKVTLKGKGKFTGTATKTFIIGYGSFGISEDGGWTDNSVDKLQVAVGGKVYWSADGVTRNYYEATYTGKEVKPSVVITMNGSKLAASNYTLTYSNNINLTGNTDSTRAKITIVGKGSYTGGKIVYFDIVSKNLADKTKMSYGSIKNQTYSAAGLTPLPTVKYNKVALVVNQDFTIGYKSGGTEVSTITKAGTYTAVLHGKGIYTGDYTYPKSFTVKQVKLKAADVAVMDTALTVGSDRPNVTVTSGGQVLTEGTDYSVSCPTLSSTGKYTLTVTGTGNFTGTVKTTLNVYEAGTKLLTSEDCTALFAGETFVGEGYAATFRNAAVKPVMTVYDDSRGMTLTSGKDYTISFSNNKNVGTAIATIKGKGGYEGQIKRTFEIQPLLAGDKIDNTPDEEPEPIPDDDDDSTPTVTDNNTTPTVTDNNTTPTVTDNNTTPTVTDNNTTPTVTDNNTTPTATDNNTKTTATDNNTTPTATDNNTKTTATDNNTPTATDNNVETAKGEIDVTTAAKGADIPSAVTNNGVTISLKNAALTYTGKAQTPAVTVTFGKTKLKNKTDYDIVYLNPLSTEAGVYTLTVNFKGNYTGTETMTYRIEKIDLSALSISIPKQYYAGADKAVEPLPSTYTVKIGKNLVDAASEGLVIAKYSGNKGVTKNAVATVAASSVSKNIKLGTTKDVKFEIAKHTINSDDIAVKIMGEAVVNNASDYEAQYTGKAITFSTEELEIADTKTPAMLALGTDYTVSYSSNTNPGKKATITIKGKGSYSGTRKITFTIIGRDLTGVRDFTDKDGNTTWIERSEVTLFTNAKSAALTTLTDAAEKDIVTGTTYTYSGSQIKPSVRLRYDSALLKSGTDYTVTYLNNTDAGTATAVITGKGKYSGTIFAHYAINPISWTWINEDVANRKPVVSGIASKYTWTGKEIVPKNITVKIAKKTLKEGRDYTVDVKNSTRVDEDTGLGKGTVIISGIGNYDGVLARVTFTVEK